MGKRSTGFERKDRDFYPTPRAAVQPLLNYLPPGTFFEEPCAGDGALVRHLQEGGHRCLGQTDICPQSDDVSTCDIFDIDATDADFFITNPPWTREFLHRAIYHCSEICPTWLLFDADWMHTKQSMPFMPRLRRIISVGRVKWFGNCTGKDNCCWYLFDKPVDDPVIEFMGRHWDGD